MASVEETRKQIEETRAELDATLGRLEDRVHYELDWRARIRRNRTALMLGGAGAVALVAAGITGTRMLRSRRHKGIEQQLKDLAHFDDIKREVVRLRDHMTAVDATQDSRSLWLKLALTATSAIGGAAGSVITKAVVARFGEDVEPRGVA